MSWSPTVAKVLEDGRLGAITLGHAAVDDYLRFVEARCRPNTLLATAYDLKVFFSIVAKDPADVTTGDVFAFITAQRAPRQGPKVVRLKDGERGTVGPDDQAPPSKHVGVVRLLGSQRRR